MSAVDEKLQIVYVSVNELRPYKGNPRKVSEKGLQKLQRSVEEFGFVNPILVQRGTNMIIAGHQRLKAAQAAGLSEVPVVWLDMDDVTAKAYNIADNRLQDESEWDFAPLADMLAELDTGAFDLTLTGFDDGELAKLMDYTPGPKNAEDMPIPELPADPVAKTGDVWQLGKHRLMCGDSTSADDVRKLVGNMKFDLMITDPPYGLGDSATEKHDYDIHSDTKENLRRIIDGFMPLYMPKVKRTVVTPGNMNHRMWPVPVWTMAWFTPAGVGCGPWGFCCWQPILCYGKDPRLENGQGSYPDALVHTESAEKCIHPCPKPLGFWKWLMERASAQGGAVVDPFMGSGTTLLVAEELGRVSYGMELSPAYCDLAVQRWEQLTGKKAELVR